ncbi:MAG: carbamoyltransferase [Gammaproteobacteria bacterium]|nr:carbamoyltransferase [Gammaproteobacteria bacterium]
MTQVILGLSGAIGHGPAAALFVDGKLVAAAEEERFIRRKHAKGEMPYHAARFCMQYAQINPSEVNIIAIPSASISIFSGARWHYARRHWYAPDRAIDSIFNGNRRYRRHVRRLKVFLEQLHIPWQEIKFVPVEHQLAHASSSYHLSGYSKKTAILTIDSRGEYASMLLAKGENGKIKKLKEFYDPDSLSGMYAAITDYLGFDIPDGEFKVMGMAPFGDPDKYDLSFLADFNGKNFKVNNKLISTVGFRRFKAKSRGHYFSRKLVEILGPRREGALVDDPYIHYAAGIQKLYEDIAAALVTHYLYPVMKESGQLVFAGTSSMNIKLNQRLESLPCVKQFFVHPACGDAGTAIGAAAYAAAKQGQMIQPLKTVFLGPKFTKAQCISACRNHRDKPQWQELENAPEAAADLLVKGKLVAWFQGRMEFGPRALGNRSILGNPGQPEVTDLLNSRVKFRERWRPFCPSLLDTFAADFLDSETMPKYMCTSVPVKEKWREKFSPVVFHDGTTRPQVVTHDANPRFYQLLKFMEEKTGFGIVINASLNRPAEALVCSPEDAVNMFIGSELEYMIMEDILVTKRDEPEDW